VTALRGSYTDPWHPNYDVLPDGKGFVMVQPVEQDRQLIMVMNWGEELRQRAEPQLGNDPRPPAALSDRYRIERELSRRHGHGVSRRRPEARPEVAIRSCTRVECRHRRRSFLAEIKVTATVLATFSG
jgi:hypothetical protein